MGKEKPRTYRTGPRYPSSARVSADHGQSKGC
jgi:hypothetical protein